MMNQDLVMLSKAKRRGLALSYEVEKYASCAHDRIHSIPRSLLSLLSLIFAAIIVTSSMARSQSAIAYTITFTSPEEHLAEVQIILPPGTAERELQLPVWNALYQVRDFAQYVNWVRAKDRAGRPVAVTAVDKSRWQISDAPDGAIVEYQLYLDSPGPFGVQFNSHHAFLNLAQVLMYPVDARAAPVRIHFDRVPEGWHIATPLAPSGDGEGDFTATSYDRAVDSPVEMGNFQESDFDEAGGHFRVIVDADPADYDMAKLVAALHKIVVAATSWMNDRPFDAYTFIYHFPHGPAGGGMEHAYSTAIELSADSVKNSFENFTGVTSHEFFHLWNVKRIRPRTLEPVDYTKENFTRALWFSEGVTSTAEGIIELRAGIIDEKQYLAELGEQITELERRPAHLTQSAEESSLDAWLEGDGYYRRPERSISYYNKGELLGVALDLAVRDASHGQASLREVLQWMNENYARKGRFFDDSAGVREAAEAVSHADLGPFFAKYVAGTEEISWSDFFRAVGLHVVAMPNTLPDAGFIASRNFDGPMTVAAVISGSGAEHAGLQVGDTIIELQGKPAGQESRQEILRMNPGDTLTIKARSRRGLDRELKFKVGSRQEFAYRLQDVDQITPQQRARRTAWLKGEAETQAYSPTSMMDSKTGPEAGGVGNRGVGNQ